MNDSHRSSNGNPTGINNVNQASSSGVGGSGNISHIEPTPKGRENARIDQERPAYGQETESTTMIGQRTHIITSEVNSKQQNRVGGGAGQGTYGDE